MIAFFHLHRITPDTIPHIFFRFHFLQVWNFGGTHAHGSTSSPSYVLHVSNPVRRVTWRPGYETELAVAYYSESTFNPNLKTPQSGPLTLSPSLKQKGLESENVQAVENALADTDKSSPSMIAMPEQPNSSGRSSARSGELVEIWDVRRPWLSKWTVTGSDGEGGVSGKMPFPTHELIVHCMRLERPCAI